MSSSIFSRFFRWVFSRIKLIAGTVFVPLFLQYRRLFQCVIFVKEYLCGGGKRPTLNSRDDRRSSEPSRRRRRERKGRRRSKSSMPAKQKKRSKNSSQSGGSKRRKTDGDPRQTTLDDFLIPVNSDSHDDRSNDDTESSKASSSMELSMPKSRKGQRGSNKSTPAKETVTKMKGPGRNEAETDQSQGDTTKDKRLSEGNKGGQETREYHHLISDSETETESSADTQPSTPRKLNRSQSPRRQQSRLLLPSSWSSRDTEAYRNGYPGKMDNMSLNDNLKFYNNEIESKPKGTLIDVMHKHWFEDFRLLEEHHGYIQWLFPIREQGMNWQSQELQPHEAKTISRDHKMRERVLKSYELMLHFWGMHLENRKTGRIRRDENWEERFRHLNRSSHNYLRITRMLKSLGELGFEHLKFPFLSFALQEIIQEKTLAKAQTSCLTYWIYTLRNEQQLAKIRSDAEELLNKAGQY